MRSGGSSTEVGSEADYCTTAAMEWRSRSLVPGEPGGESGLASLQNTNRRSNQMTIEVYVGLYEGNAQTWSSGFLDLKKNQDPEKLDEDDLLKLLLKQMPGYKTEHIAFIGILCDNVD
jgi:hypothetical protein